MLAFIEVVVLVRERPAKGNEDEYRLRRNGGKPLHFE